MKKLKWKNSNDDVIYIKRSYMSIIKMDETPTIFLKAECARDWGLARTLAGLFYHIFATSCGLYLFRRCLFSLRPSFGEHRNAASYFLEAHLLSLSRCCRMQHVTLYCILIVCKVCNANYSLWLVNSHRYFFITYANSQTYFNIKENIN